MVLIMLFLFFKTPKRAKAEPDPHQDGVHTQMIARYNEAKKEKRAEEQLEAARNGVATAGDPAPKRRKIQEVKIRGFIFLLYSNHV